jgi:hypothetical protein
MMGMNWNEYCLYTLPCQLYYAQGCRFQQGGILFQNGVRYLAKLQHADPTSGLQHSVCLTQGRWQRRHVADTKGDSIQVDRVVGDV